MTEAAMKVRLRYVIEDQDRHGNVRTYFRAPGKPKVRLREKPGTPEFMAEYQCAALGMPYVSAVTLQTDKPLPRAKILPGTFRWLCVEYFTRAAATVTERTMHNRRTILERICQKNADKPYAQLQKRHVESWRDARASHGPSSADDLVKAVSAMFAWAVKNGLASANPCAGVERLGGRGDGYHAWTMGEFEAFEARHPAGTTPHTALMVFLFTGLRISDVAIFGRQHLQLVRNPDTGQDETWIRITPQKTSRSSGVIVELPVLPELATALKAAPVTSMTFLLTQQGKPFTVAGLGNKMRDWCDAAGLPQCSAHGLRKLGATLAAENGATHEQLKAVFGWSSYEQADHYIKSARKRSVAQAASRLLVVQRKVPPISR